METKTVSGWLADKRIKNAVLVISAVLVVASVIFSVLFQQFQRVFLIAGVYPELVLTAYCFRGKPCKPFRLLGSVSFAVYVWHYPLMAFEMLLLKLANYEITQSYGTMILFTVFTWIIAWLAYQYIEVPLSKIIKKREK